MDLFVSLIVSDFDVFCVSSLVTAKMSGQMAIRPYFRTQKPGFYKKPGFFA
ncbi:hypothetical protein [Okeania sp.]|uniref:hypothetical protein n=1 Tax=Okeania sp. TaxID=3100323 RepID=UPI002B4AB638|nr:hypothetical protein [Okeania sp.]